MQNTETPSTPIREVAVTLAGFEHLPLTMQSQASTATSVQADWRIQGCGEPGELTSSAATVTPPAHVCRTADLLSENQMCENLPSYDGQDESTEVVFNTLIDEKVSKECGGGGWCNGNIETYDKNTGLWTILFENGDEEKWKRAAVEMGIKNNKVATLRNDDECNPSPMDDADNTFEESEADDWDEGEVIGLSTVCLFCFFVLQTCHAWPECAFANSCHVWSWFMPSPFAHCPFECQKVSVWNDCFGIIVSPTSPSNMQLLTHVVFAH